MSRLPADAFRRYDESPDEEFYRLPRFVTHIQRIAVMLASLARPIDLPA